MRHKVIKVVKSDVVEGIEVRPKAMYSELEYSPDRH